MLFVFRSTVSTCTAPAPNPESYGLRRHILDSMFRSGVHWPAWAEGTCEMSQSSQDSCSFGVKEWKMRMWFRWLSHAYVRRNMFISVFHCQDGLKWRVCVASADGTTDRMCRPSFLWFCLRAQAYARGPVDLWLLENIKPSVFLFKDVQPLCSYKPGWHDSLLSIFYASCLAVALYCPPGHCYFEPNNSLELSEGIIEHYNVR